MALTNIAAIFSNIVETPQQRQQRLLAEGQASAAQFTGLPTGIRELAMGIGSNIPRNVEAVRRLGVQAGLPMQTQGEQLQGAMRGLNVQNPADQAEMVRLLSNIDPIRGAAAAAIFEEENQRLEDREAQKDYQELQTRNIEGQLAARELETDTKKTALDELTLARGALAESVNISSALTEEEKQNLINQIEAGVYDGNPAGLRERIDPTPLRSGNEVLVKTPNGWAFFERNTTSEESKLTSLLASAALQYGSGTPSYEVVAENIRSGNITDGGDFKDYAPLSINESVNIPSSVEAWFQEGYGKGQEAYRTIGKIDSAFQLMDEHNLLQTGKAGFLSDIKEGFDQALGTRDAESWFRTAFSNVKNTEIINSLPPGVASDRDIQIFSAGFPPENAAPAEIYNYFKAARNIHALQYDIEHLRENFLQKQLLDKEGGDATSIGFNVVTRNYAEGMKKLREIEQNLSTQFSTEQLTHEEANQEFLNALLGFEAEFGIQPTEYK